MLLIKMMSIVWNHLGDREEKGDREGAPNTNLPYHAKLIFNFPWAQSVCDAKGPGHCRICSADPARVFSFQEVLRGPNSMYVLIRSSGSARISRHPIRQCTTAATKSV